MVYLNMLENKLLLIMKKFWQEGELLPIFFFAGYILLDGTGGMCSTARVV